jgi:predicted alpha/beta hydrolase family esterase
MIYLLFIFVVCIFLLLYTILLAINRLFIFHPYKASRDEYDNLSVGGRKDYFIKVQMKTKDNITLYGGLVNSLKEPSWDDIIFLYSHGNSGWIGNLINYDTIRSLSKYGSVFIYDYRGFGLSEGVPSEEGLYTDVTTAWNFLTTKKGIPSDRIIVFGHSLGTSVSSKLVAKIVTQNKKYPRGLILDAPFTTMKSVADQLNPSLSFLLVYQFNNIDNLSQIKNKVPVCVFHSKIDDVIPYNHSLILKNNTGCKMIDISGSHHSPVYDEKVHNFIKSLIM